MTAVPCALFAASTVLLLFAVRNADRARLRAEAHWDAWERAARKALAESFGWKARAADLEAALEIADLKAASALEFADALCFGDKKEAGE